MASSSDGVVTATVDAATASILLAVDFTVTGSPVASGSRSSINAVAVTEVGTGRPVRGMYKGSAPGGVIAGIDHEAPFGSPLSYVAVAYNGAGVALGMSASVGITVPVPTTGDAWLKSLATPGASLNLDASAANELEWSRDIAEGRIQVIGRPDPIVIQDVRRFGTATISFMTESPAKAVALEALLSRPGPYLLQMPRVGEPDRYVTVGSYSSKLLNPYDLTHPVRVWSLPLTQVVRPDTAGWSVAIPGHTYDDSSARWPLYSNRTGTYNLRATT